MTLAEDASLDAALAQATEAVRTDLGTDAPDLLLVFTSEHHAAAYERVPDLVHRGLTPGLLLGCSAGGVIGGGREVERAAAVSVTAACLPGVDVMPVLLGADSLPGPDAPVSAWEETVHGQGGEHRG